ncbi:BQ2448_2425 [Microbotryum intermedium]|uniref:BQ2448_2425 protein n=1 Tax=Microbotryum intermedium TaxID=269621 RepID=A0A238F880_9BASI|nr:BQ2448_2425 [Microbotryum intermedium]
MKLGTDWKELKKHKSRRPQKPKSGQTTAPPKTSFENAPADPPSDLSDEWSDSSDSHNKEHLPSSSSVCPRSVYRLADYLHLKPLRELAFDDIKEKITVDNVAVELFSSFTEAYEEVHKFELDFCVRNWVKIKFTPAMKEVERRIANRDPEMQRAAATLYQISMRFTKVRVQSEPHDTPHLRPPAWLP